MVILREGMFEYREIVGGRSSRTARQQISARFYPDPQDDQICRFNLQSTEKAAVKQLSLEGKYDIKNKSLIETKGNFMLEMIDFASLPERVENWQKFYEMSQPAGEVVTQSSYDSNSGHSISFTLKDGRLRLPVPGAELPLSGVNAEIVCRGERILIKELSGRYENYCRFEAAGAIEGYSQDAPFEVRLKTIGLNVPDDQWIEVDDMGSGGEVPGANEYLNSVKAPLGPLLSLLPEKIGKIVSRFSPTGQFDVELSFVRGQEQNELYPWSFQGRVVCRGAAGVYERFPYRVSPITGEIIFSADEVRIGPLQAVNGEESITIEGRWRREGRESSGLEVIVQAAKTTLNERLYNALKGRYQRFWDKFSPAGLINCEYSYSRKPDEESQRRLEVELLDASACCEDLAVPLSGLKGKIISYDDEAAFEIEEGSASSGRVSLTGQVNNLQKRYPDFYCTVDFSDLLVDEEFISGLGQRQQEFCRKLNLQGLIDGQGQFRRDTVEQVGLSDWGRIQEQDNISYHIKADLREGEMLYEEFLYQLYDANGEFEITNDELTIHSLTARHEKSQIQISGVLGGDDSYRLQVQCQPLQLDEQLSGILAKRLAWLAEFRTKGLADLTLDIERKQGQELSCYSGLIEPQGCELGFADAEYGFGDLRGRVVVEGERINIEKLTSTKGGGKVALRGVVKSEAWGKKYDLELKMDRLELDRQLRGALGRSFKQLCERLDLAGDITGKLRLEGGKDPARAGLWTMEGQIALTKGTLGRPMPSSDINMRIKGKAQYDTASKEFRLRAKLQDTELRIKQRRLSDLTAELSYDEKEKQLVLSDITGTLCQGRLAGDVWAGVGAEGGGYQLQLQFNKLDLSELLQADKKEDEKKANLRGSFTGWFNLTKPRGAEPRRGSFVFVVKEAVLGELPIMAQLLHVLNLSLPKEGAFNEAYISGDIVGPKTRFDPIHLRGSAMGLTGGGIMTEPGNQLELVFVVDSPHDLPQVPVISSFVTAIKGQIAQVRLSGTFDEPKVEPIAFPSLDDALRQLSVEETPVPSAKP